MPESIAAGTQNYDLSDVSVVDLKFFDNGRASPTPFADFRAGYANMTPI